MSQFPVYILYTICPGNCEQIMNIFLWRIEAVPIRLLRSPGIETADKTGKLPHPVGAMQTFVPRYGIAPHAFPFEGRCQP